MTVLFNDGGSHNISTASPDIVVSNSTTLTVGTGASIVAPGPSGDVVGYPGITARDSTVTITGGSIAGGLNRRSTSHAIGIYAENSNLSISGSPLVTGGAATGPANPDGVAAWGLYWGAYGAKSLTIGGGTFVGGSGGIAVQAARIYAGGPATVNINGGTFIFPSSGNPHTFESAPLFLAAGDGATVSVRGGLFQGGWLEGLIIVCLGRRPLQPTPVVGFMGSGLNLATETFPSTGVHSGVRTYRLTGTLTSGQAINSPLFVWVSRTSEPPFPDISATSTLVQFTT